MVSDERDGRIEIELTAHAPVADRDVGDDTVAEQTPIGPAGRDAEIPSGVEPAGWLASERNRLIVAAGAAGVIALLLGWMLGRSGGDDAATAPAASVAEAAADTTEPERSPEFEAADALPETDVDVDELIEAESTVPATSPPIRVPPPTTEAIETVELEPGADGLSIAIDGRILGAEATLITADRDRRLIEIDLATGAVVQRGDLLAGSVERMFGGSNWIATVQDGSRRLLIDTDAGDRTEISGIDTWNLVVDTRSDVLWVRSDALGGGGSFEERDLLGNPTGRAVTLPAVAWPIGFADGSFLTSVLGDTYRIGPDGHEFVADGELLAASAAIVVVTDCDDDLQCGLRVVDRTTGADRWLPPGPGGLEQRYLPLQWYFAGRVEGALSPDGRWMTVIAPGEFSESAGLLDLESGEFTEIPELGLDGFGVTWDWGVDGRFAFFVQDRIPWVYDLETQEAFRLSPDVLVWSGLVVRANDAA